MVAWRSGSTVTTQAPTPDENLAARITESSPEEDLHCARKRN